LVAANARVNPNPLVAANARINPFILLTPVGVFSRQYASKHFGLIRVIRRLKFFP